MKWVVKGVVKKYSGKGHELGYPTANIEIASDAEEGVFLGYTIIPPPSNLPPRGGRISPPLRGGDKGKGKRAKLPSLIFIGAPETFGRTDKRLEAYILDWEGNLYGREIEVEIVKKLRDNRKFESVGKLILHMKEDERLAREFFEK